MINEREIIQSVLAQYKLPLLGYHGVAHWARVYENGLRIAKYREFNEEQTTVVKLFALLHDACRENENHDPEHGQRASKIMLRRLVEDTELLAECSVPLLGALSFAIDQHAEGKLAKDYPAGLIDVHPEVQACWDADRLDLDRVGIKPSRKLLGIKDTGLIWFCRRGGIESHIPLRVLTDWQVELRLP